MTANPSLIDSHCHLDSDYGPKSDADLVREAELGGVVAMMTIATDMASLDKVRQISERHPNVYHSVGVHPHEAITVESGLPAAIETLRQASTHPKCRAIGEIGLDYHYDHSPRDVQKQVLEKQLELALQVALPIVIHSREGEADLLALLEPYARRCGERVPGVIHCFTGTKEFGLRCIELGFYISFSGILTFKNADSLRECARVFPLERLMVETDSPFLAPVPHRGRKCEPSMVHLTAEKIAELRGVPLAEVAAVTTANARRVFKIGGSAG